MSLLVSWNKDLYHKHICYELFNYVLLISRNTLNEHILCFKSFILLDF